MAGDEFSLDDDFDLQDDSAFDLEVPLLDEDDIFGGKDSDAERVILLEDDEDLIELAPVAAAAPSRPAAPTPQPVVSGPASSGPAGASSRPLPGGYTCPRCLRRVAEFRAGRNDDGGTEYWCPECNDSVPIRFVQDYGRIPFVQFSLAGLTGNGKTCFLRGLFHAFNNGLGQRWPDFSYEPLGTRDGERLGAWLDDRVLPAGTAEQVETVGLRLYGLPGVADVDLLMFDISGEAFKPKKQGILQRKAYHVQRSDVITLLVSLDKIHHQFELNTMLQSLEEGLQRTGAAPKDKTLLIVLTKGDELLADLTLPPLAQSFLTSEQAADPIDVGRLDALSAELKQWLDRHPRNYAPFVRNADRKFRQVRYTVISALGFAPDQQNRMEYEMRPRNVIAPLLLLLNWSLPRVTVATPQGARRFYDLDSAVTAAEAAEGEGPITMELSSGRFTLSRRWTMQRRLVLTGQGADVTSIVGEVPETLVLSQSPDLRMQGITFRRSGAAPGNVLTVMDGRVELTDCRFEGGVRNQRLNCRGHGLDLQHASERPGAAPSRLVRCQASGNQQHGIHIFGGSRVELESSECTDNGGDGLVVAGRSSAQVSSGTFERNRDGIFVCGHASARLSKAGCRQNRRCGMLFGGDAGGSVEGSRCVEQERGIVVTDRAGPALRGNQCRNNRAQGICINKHSTPTLTANDVCENGGSGIDVQTQGAAAVDKNSCLNNGKYGIYVHALARAARVSSTGNHCAGNKLGQFVDRRPRGWLRRK